MAYDGSFHPTGPTVLVGLSVVQVPTSDNTFPTSYRISALLATRQYLGWAPQATTAPAINVVIPTAGVPSPTSIGFPGLSTEVMTFPPNAFFKADAAAAFEVTPGEGV